jgi:hypothetical protein
LPVRISMRWNATLRLWVRCNAASGWSASKGQHILHINVHQHLGEYHMPNYIGIPLARLSETPPWPPCVMKRPVACGN